MSGLMIFYFCAFALISMYSQYHSLRQEKLANLNFLARHVLVSEAQKALSVGGKDDIIRIAQNYIENTPMVSIKVETSEGDIFILQEYDEHELSHAPITITSDIYRRRLQLPPTYDIDVDNGILSTSEVLIGKLTVYVDDSLILRDVVSFHRYSLIGFFLAPFAILPIAYLVIVSLIRPLTGIMNNLGEFKRGNYRTPNPGSLCRDEYDEITDTLREAGNAIEDKTNQLKEYAEALEMQVNNAIAARQEADEANATKDSFVSNMAHEMKTPLSGVESGLGIADDCLYTLLSKIDEIPARSHIWGDDIKRFKSDLLSVIQTVEIAKLSNSKIVDIVTQILCSVQDVYDDVILSPKPIELTTAFDRLLRHQAVYAEQKGLEFICNLPSSSCWVKTDWERLAEIINALVSNALRFTVRGRVSVDIYYHILPEKLQLDVEITDTGIGMVDSEKNQILKLFHTADPADKTVLGIGTGLAISKCISAKMGGELSLKSTKLGKGSSFSFRVPLSQVSKNESEESVKKFAGRALDILYVEDSAVARMLFQDYCKTRNANLITTDSGGIGYTKYVSGHFDALIIDCHLPDMSGYELARKIRSYERSIKTKEILLIAFTSSPSPRSVENCFDAGFDYSFSKPLSRTSVDEMLSLTKAHLKEMAN